MTCNEFRTLLDRMEAGAPLAEDMLLHMESCPGCAMAHTLHLDCRTLDEDSEVPASFSSSWRQAIRKESSPMEKKPLFTAPVKRWLATAAALVVLLSGTLITRNMLNPAATKQTSTAPSGDSYYMPSTYARDAVPNMEAAAVDYSYDWAGAEAAPQAALQQKQAEIAKVIRTIDMTLSTREFDTDLEKIKKTLVDLGGYVEDSTVSSEVRNSRYARLKLRVPAAKLDDFLLQMRSVGRSVSVSENAEDVSEKYTDIETRLKTQQEKMARLQEMMKRALTIKELLEIETSIADTQYQIDSLSGSLKGMDSKVSFSTVSIYLKEELASDIVETKEATLGDRILSALTTTWKNAQAFFSDMLVFLVVTLPFVVGIVILVVIVKTLIKRRKNKK